VTAGPAARSAAYARQQEALAAKRAQTTRQIAEALDACEAAGDLEGAAWWADLLTERTA